MADFVQPDTSGWNFVEEQWEAPDVEDFEQAGFDDPTQAFIDVHAVHNVEDPEDAEDVSIPLARPTSDGDLESPYEAWNSAHDMISREDLSDDEVEEARSWMESVREEEFPDREPLDEGEDEEATHPDEEDEEDDDEQGMNAMERDEPAGDRGVFAVNGRDVDTVTRDDEELLRVPIQAIEPDRKGTKFTAEAQEEIIDQLQSGTVPAFPNHGKGDSGVLYDYREIMGKWVDGEMEDGVTFGFLRLREGNEDAEELRDLLEQDMPVGFSVGFDDAEMNEQEDGPDEITGLDLVETSPVGIPATPSAVPQANDESALAVATYSAVRATDGVDVDEFMQALRSEVSQMADEQRDEAPEQGDEPDDESRQTEDNDGRLTAEQVEDAVYTALRKVRIEEQTERLELRAEGDVGDQDVLEFAASHFDGMDVADFTAVVDDEGGEYVGSLNLPEAAALIAERIDEDQGTVMDALDDLQSNEANQDDDEDDEDDEEDEMSADDEPEDADGGLDGDERTVDPDDANDSAGKTIDTADEDDETTEDNDGPEPRDEAYFSGP